ncbi:class I SAM-dependent methyltransferase [Promineifilum sp.]|uniref:class I SAM-dependent methyltransferase n=1 Tax=Promineifilum sp. TaxID=2664178 RepID=UPI0035B1CCEF
MTAAKIALDSRSAVAETLLIPLYFRALELREPNPLLRDETAAALVERLDYDFGRVKLQGIDRVGAILRARQFDRWTRAFLAGHPSAAVVHIGCGLDTRFERVDNGEVAWYDLDLPEVIDLRRALLSPRPRNRWLACSVFDPAWVEVVAPIDRSFLFVAEGVLPYFEETRVKGLILMLRQHFPGAELICDAMTPLLVKLKNLELIASGVKARLHWGLRRGRDMERWGGGIRLLEEWFYFDEPEPRLASSRWMRYFPPFGRGVGVFHYRLGDGDRAIRR